MNVEEHTKLQYTQYKESSAKLIKLMDLIDVFTTVNSRILKQDEDDEKNKTISQRVRGQNMSPVKIEQGQIENLGNQEPSKEPTKNLDLSFDYSLGNKKALKQFKITKIFREMSEQLQNIKSMLKEIRVVPVKSGCPEHNIWSYYFGLSEFERVELDCQVIMGQNNRPIFPTTRSLPIIHQEDKDKLKVLIQKVDDFVENCRAAVKPIRCCCKKRTSCFCCFRQIFGSTYQMGMILAKTFEGNPIQIKVDKEKDIFIDCMFFTTTCEPQIDDKIDSKYKKLPTFILFFLNKNINVMIWNYRGYGLSLGTPDPYIIRQDAEVLLAYMKTKMNLTGKIGVYGRSLGGVVTTHLADQVDMIFADRTFANFDILADRKFYSVMSKKLFKMGTCNWKANNVQNFIEKGAKNCYKVVLTEKIDEIIEVHSSLQVGVVREIHNKCISKFFFDDQQTATSYIDSLKFITNLEHDLYNIIDYQNLMINQSTDENDVTSSGFFMCCPAKQYSSSSSVKNAGSSMSKIQPDNERGGNTLMTISDTNQIVIRFKNNQQSKLYKDSVSRVKKALKYKQLNKNKELQNQFVELWQCLNEICNQMYNIMGAQLLFHDVVNINKKIHALEIKNFILLMKFYGGCSELEAKVAPNIYNHKISREISKTQVQGTFKVIKDQMEVIALLRQSNPFLNSQYDLVNSNLFMLQKFFDNTLDYLSLPNSNFSIYRHQIDSNSVQNQQTIQESQIPKQTSQSDFTLNDHENYLSPNYIGHMIPLKCGHTGQPSNEEAYLMEKHLRAAGFLQQNQKETIKNHIFGAQSNNWSNEASTCNIIYSTNAIISAIKYNSVTTTKLEQLASHQKEKKNLLSPNKLEITQQNRDELTVVGSQHEDFRASSGFQQFQDLNLHNSSSILIADNLLQIDDTLKQQTSMKLISQIDSNIKNSSTYENGKQNQKQNKTERISIMTSHQIQDIQDAVTNIDIATTTNQQSIKEDFMYNPADNLKSQSVNQSSNNYNSSITKEKKEDKIQENGNHQLQDTQTLDNQQFKMVFGDYELIHTKRVNRERSGRDVFKHRYFEARGGYTPYYFGAVSALIVQQLSGTSLKTLIPSRSLLTRAGINQYLKVAGLFILFPYFNGFCIGFCFAGDLKECKKLTANQWIYQPEMNDYKKEIYYS
eukprot:403374299